MTTTTGLEVDLGLWWPCAAPPKAGGCRGGSIVGPKTAVRIIIRTSFPHNDYPISKVEVSKLSSNLIGRKNSPKRRYRAPPGREPIPHFGAFLPANQIAGKFGYFIFTYRIIKVRK
jgi:hypothetical protein